MHTRFHSAGFQRNTIGIQSSPWALLWIPTGCLSLSTCPSFQAIPAILLPCSPRGRIFGHPTIFGRLIVVVDKGLNPSKNMNGIVHPGGVGRLCDTRDIMLLEVGGSRMVPNTAAFPCKTIAAVLNGCQRDLCRRSPRRGIAMLGIGLEATSIYGDSLVYALLREDGSLGRFQRKIHVPKSQAGQKVQGSLMEKIQEFFQGRHAAEN